MYTNRSYYTYLPRYNHFELDYGDNVGMILNYLRNSLLFLQERTGTEKKRLWISSQKAKVEFRLVEKQDFYKMIPYLILDEEEQLLKPGIKVLTSNPVWLLINDQLVEVPDFNNAAYLLPFVHSNFEFIVSKNEFNDFLNLLPLKSELFKHCILPDDYRIETLEKITEKRIYLTEEADELRVKLKFTYGNVEVDFQSREDVMWRSVLEDKVFVKVIRNRQAEAEAFDILLNSGVTR